MSKVPTIRVLGVIEGWCVLNDIELVEQESTVYRTGMKWAGLPVPKSNKTHVPDQQSAMGHGVYYLHKKKGLWEIKL